MTIKQQILDVCCGMKMFHHNKNNPDVLFMDIRHGDYSVDSKKALVYPAMPIISNKVNHKGSTHFVVFYKTIKE